MQIPALLHSHISCTAYFCAVYTCFFQYFPKSIPAVILCQYPLIFQPVVKCFEESFLLRTSLPEAHRPAMMCKHFSCRYRFQLVQSVSRSFHSGRLGLHLIYIIFLSQFCCILPVPVHILDTRSLCRVNILPVHTFSTASSRMHVMLSRRSATGRGDSKRCGKVSATSQAGNVRMTNAHIYSNIVEMPNRWQ